MEPASEAREANGTEPTVYTARDEGGAELQIRATSVEEAIQRAEAWVREGDYGEAEETVWPRVWLFRDDEELAESFQVAIDPPEPACRTDTHRYPGHEWRQSSVIGHGGGVIVEEACQRCGFRRTTDTWAQDPETGAQGLRSVRYSPAESDDDAGAESE